MKEKIIVIYHGDCPDGFGGAYAAWKKFGADAEYIAANDRNKPEVDLADKETYIIDFSYPKEVLLDIEKKATKLVVLDHHIGVKDTVEAVREHIFDDDRSGTGIAWGYFHPEEPLPKMLTYVQDNDLWRFTLPQAKEIAAFLGTIEFDFAAWDSLVREFGDDAQFAKIAERGKIYREYFDHACAQIIKDADVVELGEYRVFAVNAPRLFSSAVGHMLALKKPPFAIVWRQKNDIWNFSLRGDGSIDLTTVAARYGGSGHKDSAGFRLPLSSPLPFKIIPKEEEAL